MMRTPSKLLSRQLIDFAVASSQKSKGMKNSDHILLYILLLFKSEVLKVILSYS